MKTIFRNRTSFFSATLKGKRIYVAKKLHSKELMWASLSLQDRDSPCSMMMFNLINYVEQSRFCLGRNSERLSLKFTKHQDKFHCSLNFSTPYSRKVLSVHAYKQQCKEDEKMLP